MKTFFFSKKLRRAGKAARKEYLEDRIDPEIVCQPNVKVGLERECMMQQSGEKPIVEDGLQPGCADSWQIFYDQYADRVWKLVAYWMGSQPSDVADVVQETFLAAARSAAAFDPKRGNLMNWIAGIARNQVALHFRKQQRIPQTLANDPDANQTGLFEQQTARDPEPDENMTEQEQRSLVRQALLQLSDEYALLLSARYLEDQSTVSLATQYNCSESAIRSRLVRARKAFRTTLNSISSSHDPFNESSR